MICLWIVLGEEMIPRGIEEPRASLMVVFVVISACEFSGLADVIVSVRLLH